MTDTPEKIEDEAKDETIEAILDKYLTTDKRKAFVREYITDFNATQAAIRAGYSKNGAHVQGHRLLSNANIAKCVSKVRTARVAALDFGPEDLIAYRVSVIESPTASEADKSKAAAALQKIWGLEKNEINVNVHGILPDRLSAARARRAKK